jgi:MaoC like domain
MQRSPVSAKGKVFFQRRCSEPGSASFFYHALEKRAVNRRAPSREVLGGTATAVRARCGWYLDQAGISAGRTITQSDVVNFAGLTGDYNPLYADESSARPGPFRGRIVRGMLVFTAAFGLADSAVT